jgi:hypothetical protein
MIATTTELSFATSDSAVAKGLSVYGRRRITPEVGRALEKLDHAIEYLMDEIFYEGHSRPGSHHRLEAVKVMTALRQQIYVDAPEIQPFGTRCRTFLTQLLA